MRGGRSLLVLLAVALGLGAYIYFVESEREPAGTETKEQAFDVEPADITEVTIRATSGETTTLRRSGDSWTLTAPVSAPADSTVVESIVSSLSTMEIDRVLEENATDLGPYGLETPRLVVDFTTTDGATRRLSVGNTTPTSSGMYARLDEASRLLLVPAFLESTFDRTPFDLRNRRVLEVDRDTVDRVTLAPRGATAVELQRDGANWRLAAPVEARADFSPADSILSRLTTAQMSSIVKEGGEPTADERRAWGLDTPQLTATVGAGSTSATLALGAARDDGSIYARDLSRPIVFTVDGSLLTDLRKEPGDLRVKDIFEFNAFSAQTLEVTHGDTAVAYAKSVPPSGADASAQPTWSQTRPQAGDVNQTALTDLLNALSALRADRFVAQVPGGGETIEIAVRFGSSDAPSDERATLRRSGETVYATRDGEPGAAVIPAGEFDTVLTHLNTLTAPVAAPAEPATP